MLDNSFFDKIFIIGFGLRQSSSVLIAEHGKRLLHDAFWQQSGHIGGDKVAAHDFIHKAKFHGAVGINPCFLVHHGADFIAGFPGLAHIGVGKGITGNVKPISCAVQCAVVSVGTAVHIMNHHLTHGGNHAVPGHCNDTCRAGGVDDFDIDLAGILAQGCVNVRPGMNITAAGIDVHFNGLSVCGGKGIRNYDASKDKVAAVKIVDDVDDVLLSSQEGIIIRLHANEIPVQSRYGSGVRVMRLGENDKVMVLARTDHDDEAQTETVEAEEGDEPTAEQLAAMEAADEASASEAPSEE